MPSSETTTRVLFLLVGALTAALIAVVIVLLTRGDDSKPSGRATPAQPTQQTTDADVDETDDAALAAFLQLTVDNIADITKSDWDIDQSAAGVDLARGFCNGQLNPGAIEVSQATHNLSVDGPGKLPRVTTLGAVFPTEKAAEQYLQDRAGSDACGDWTDGNLTLEVTQPPSTPTLVGCKCQDVQLHRVDAFYPGSRVDAQYAIVARQDRFVSMAFYTINERAATSDDALAMVAELQDRLVERVNEIATTS